MYTHSKIILIISALSPVNPLSPIEEHKNNKYNNKNNKFLCNNNNNPKIITKDMLDPKVYKVSKTFFPNNNKVSISLRDNKFNNNSSNSRNLYRLVEKNMLVIA